MANCNVLEANQKSTDKPSRRIKRSGGQSLVRQMKAFWVIENVLLQMVDVRSLAPRERAEVQPSAYIPEEMPPVIDKRLGVHFVDPIKCPAMPRFRRISNFERLQQFEL